MPELPNAASVALFHRGKVLLIQRAREPWSGRWSLPGGRLEPGEDAESCAAREVKEEVGLSVFALRPVARLRLGEGAQFVLQVFGTEAFEGEIAPQAEEIRGWRWHDPALLGTLPTTPHLGEVLARASRLFDRS